MIIELGLCTEVANAFNEHPIAETPLQDWEVAVFSFKKLNPRRILKRFICLYNRTPKHNVGISDESRKCHEKSSAYLYGVKSHALPTSMTAISLHAYLETEMAKNSRFQKVDLQKQLTPLRDRNKRNSYF